MGTVEFIEEKGGEFIFKVNGMDTYFSAEKSSGAIKYRPSEALDHEEILLQSLKISSEQLVPKYHLPFLKIAIFVLADTQRRFIKNPDLFEDLISLYWQSYNKLLEDGEEISHDIVRDVCERYLDLLANDENQDWFDRMASGKGTSREEEVIKVAEKLKELEGRCDERGKTPADSQEKVRQALRRAKDMLMAWYNLKKGIEVVTALQGEKIPKPLRRFVSGWLPEIMGSVILAYCVYLKVPYFSKDVFNGFRLFGFDVLICSFYILMLCSISISFVKLSRKTKQVDLQIYLPRMAAGIIVGYLVLLSDEAWGGIFGQHEWLFVAGRILLPCVAVLIYILIEMNNVKGIRYPILGKAFRLLSRGVAYAVLTGVIVSDLFGEAIVKRILETQEICPACLHGLFGNIYPEVIFYIAPLALFIGVFLQLLWEDKTLTAKI